MAGNAFVIMQVGLEDSVERHRADEVTNYVIAPVLNAPEFELALTRADQDVTPGAISRKMLTDLLNARVVIADLTGRNPNVYYELGIAHSFNKPVISLGQPSGLPFDLQDERVIALPAMGEKLGVREAEVAKDGLMQSLRVVLAEDYEPASPLSEIATKQALQDLASDNPVAAGLATVREAIEEVRSGLSQQLEFIRHEVDRRVIQKERDEEMKQLWESGEPFKQILTALENNPDSIKELFQTIRSASPPPPFSIAPLKKAFESDPESVISLVETISQLTPHQMGVTDTSALLKSLENNDEQDGGKESKKE